MEQQRPFNSIYSHGFARVAACVPGVKVADPSFNVERITALAQRAHEDHCALALFTELGISAYSNEDLFHQDTLLEASLAGLSKLVTTSARLSPVLVVGVPIRFENKLFNCAVVLHHGRILGVTPKTYLPNYREFYEKRQFTSGSSAIAKEIQLLGQSAPFGSDIIYEADDLSGFSFHCEVCEDVWAPIAPSTYAAMAGATVLCNLSASNITIGKDAWRRELCASQSGKCVAAYLYTAAGPGESTTDLAWDGHAMIYENGNRLSESTRFSRSEQIITADVDLDRLAQERMRLSSFIDCSHEHKDRVEKMRRVKFELGLPEEEVPLRRHLARFPFVPSDEATWDERCYEAYNIQVNGLEKRLEATGIKKIVIGISGGLDSTQALLVACRTMDRLQLPRTNILAYTMPGFATSDATKSNAWALMKSLGVTAAEIDIRPAAIQMLKDIGHPFSAGQPVHDITFENVQAGQRTSHLFRLANHHNAIVLGTGDLSEIALGWNTYGVGDQMSHYNVNASVPKTLIQHLIRWQVLRSDFSDDAKKVLQAILDTEISPELVPATAGGEIQRTQAKIGPYELQDFNLYYITRFGYKPSKVAFLAHSAWKNANEGAWPPGYPAAKRNQYSLAEIKKWLGIFLLRFFGTSQFKRSAMPNGPKVGSGGSLSPRSDWRAPSDSESKIWLDELEKNVPD